MTPSGLQFPPCPQGASASVRGGPAAASIVLSLPPAKNPMDLPSGDQNGNLALSVPTRGCAVREFRDRTHSCQLPLADRAANTRRRPSSEIAGAFRLLLKSNAAPSSGGIVVVTTRASGVSRKWRKLQAINSAPVSAQGRELGLLVAAAEMTHLGRACEPLAAARIPACRM